MTPTGDGALRRDGFDIHFVEWDRGTLAPAILLLHGLSSNARYWDRVAEHIEGRRLVALDLTPDLPERAAMEALLMDAVYVVDRLHLDRPVVVGHSWGAALALELAVRHPSVVSGLVFVDGPIMGVATIFSWDEVEARMQPDFPRYTTVADAVAHTRSYLHDAWGDDLEAFVAAGLKRDGDALVPALTAPVRHRILRDLHETDAERLWPSVRVPAAALIARKSDAKISRSTEAGMLRVAEIAPSVEIKRFETPHDIPLYAPAEVAGEIERVARQAESVRA